MKRAAPVPQAAAPQRAAPAPQAAAPQCAAPAPRFPTALSLRHIVHTWWPLAASWFLMGLELPAVSAVMARFPQPDVHLAAYGGIVFPLALLIEAPIIMLLAASTALSQDWVSYLKLRRFMLWAGGGLTAVHVLVAFTPLYDLLVRRVIGVPEAIVEPGRIGMMIMTPWTWAIAYRRFQQGVLIRFGHSRAVGVGTVVRLISNATVLGLGYLLGPHAGRALPGIVAGSAAIATGVVCEAIFVALWVRPVLRGPLRAAPAPAVPLTRSRFLHFYVPLALTSLINLLILPINSLALSRMPLALSSLAVWPVIGGVVFVMRGLGIAYNEVVVALADAPRAVHGLRRFTVALSLSTSLLLLLVAATPLSQLWFAGVSALAPALAVLAGHALWIAVPSPALSVWQSWFQGIILHGRRTRGITEAVTVGIGAGVLVLAAGIVHGRLTGLYVGLAAAVANNAAQAGWLFVRSRPPMRAAQARDAAADAAAADASAADAAAADTAAADAAAADTAAAGVTGVAAGSPPACPG